MDDYGLISVIVPVYNAEKYLEKSINSVLNQTYSHWELILIDDGSLDKSKEICDKFSNRNSRIKVFHQANAGVSAARNRGIEAASGEYITFLDADDILPSYSLETLVCSLIKNKADVAMGTTCGEKWGTQSGTEIWKDEEGLQNSLMDNPYTYAAWGKLYRHEMIGETQFNTHIKINEDSFFVFQIMCKKPVCVCTDKEIYKYTQVPGSASRSTFSEKYFDILRVAEKKYAIVQEQFPHLLDLAKNMIIKANLNLLAILASRTNGEYLDIEQKLIETIQACKKYYISGKKSDDRIFSIIVHGLYPLYKKEIQIKQLISHLI